jgi:hypothetical protein
MINTKVSSTAEGELKNWNEESVKCRGRGSLKSMQLK